MDWIVENKEWIFSGIGVFVLGLVISIFARKGKVKQKSIKMKQKSGSNSTNIQIGGDYNG